MDNAIRYLHQYMADYAEQTGSLDYSDETLIDDVLYAIGVALHGAQCANAQGFDLWRTLLCDHLVCKQSHDARGAGGNGEAGEEVVVRYEPHSTAGKEDR